MSRVVLVSSLLVAAGLAACGSDGGGAGTDGGGGGGGGGGGDGSTAAMGSGFPCDVERVLQARCQGCHSTPTKFGAPMPMLTWADTQAVTPSGGAKVWEMQRTMVTSGMMPPPSSPTGALTDAEKATLMAWWTAGAPRGTAACAPADGGSSGTPPPPTSGPATLPCQPKYEFRAQGAAAGEPFVVPQMGDTYRCFSFQVPFEPQEQAIAWAPIIDDQRVLHHWILYGHTNNVQPTGCGDTGRVFLMGWAPGGQNGVMPADVGLELPNPGTWLTLEVHYNNKARYADARDRSGVAVCTTATARPKEAGVITLGSVGINIPPGADDHPVTSEIAGTLTRILPEPLHVLWTSPHMHVAGKTFRTDIIRGGQTLPLVEVTGWDFANQRAFARDPETTTIQAGDALRTTCTYKNDTNMAIRFGEKTENEMCFNFVVVYPITTVMTRQWVTR